MAIILTNIREIAKVNANVKYAIVRSYKNSIPGVQQLAALSPSSDLFFKYLDLKKKGQWNNQTFQEIYVPQFLKEMKQKEAIDALNILWTLSKTQDIAAACFCADETTCHRYVVGSLLAAAGAQVKSVNPLNVHYYKMYKAI